MTRRPTAAADYTAALGSAVYAFAELEWNAVQCCERIEAGSIASLSDRTAGRVADTLVMLAARLPDPPDSGARARLSTAATRFQALVRSRNNLLHAKPGADHDGARRLFRDGDPWTIREIEAIGAAFADCGDELAALLRGPLD